MVVIRLAIEVALFHTRLFNTTSHWDNTYRCIYIYKLYTHLPRFTALSQRPCTTSAVRTLYNDEVAEGSFTMTCS
jgi:hypothetical protein